MPKTLHRDEILRERQHIQEKLQQGAESPLGVALWQTRLESLEQELAELEEQPGQTASVALLFDGDPVIGTKEIRADFAARVLDNFQNLVSVIFAHSAGQIPTQKGRVPLIDRSRLYVREMARGSVGFVLEEKESDQVELIDTQLKEVVEKTVEIIEKVAAPELLGDPLEGLSPRAIQSAYRFAESLMKSSATAKIYSEEHEVKLPRERVETLFERLNEIRLIEDVDELPGIILGLLPESGKFEFRVHLTEETLIGDTSTDIQWRYISDPTFHERFVMRPVLAKIRRVELERAGRIQKRDFILEDVRLEEPGILPAG